MKRLVFFLVSMLLLGTGFGQVSIDLTFAAIDGVDYTQIDSIKVMNRSQGGDTVLYYPDTVLTLLMTKINERNEKETGFHLYQNYPNPVKDQTRIKLNVPSNDLVIITVTDILGRIVAKTDKELGRGNHFFSFIPGDGHVYLLTARYKGESQSIKIMCLNEGSGNGVTLKYIGEHDDPMHLKSSASITDLLYDYGDTLLYIGYYDTLQSGMLHSPTASKSYVFQFAVNIPCPGLPTVEYEGQTYNTVQIMSQCWLKENLNVGVMILGDQEMTDNDIVEKYCYKNQPDSCDKFGGLYMWWEMMQYNPHQGVQGICPPGWHIPTDEELKLLEGAVDSQFGIGDSEWDRNYVFRGFNAHEMLKARKGWLWQNSDCSGNDRYGFSALPGGRRTPSLFYSMGYYGCWLTYNHNLQAYTHAINCKNPGVGRGTLIFDLDKDAFSVRCLKD